MNTHLSSRETIKVFVLALAFLGCILSGLPVPVRAQSTYEPYSFTTFAGVSGVGNADGIGSSARFFQPSSVAADSAGNVYVADTFNHTIRKVTPTGAVSTLAGLAGVSGSADGSGGDARFVFPAGVAVDSSGSVYVADRGNTIRKITPAGVVSTFAGLAGVNAGSEDGPGNAARFFGPGGVAVDSANNVYVADSSNHTIRKITPAGLVSTLAGMAGAKGSADGAGSAARFSSPGGVAVDNAGNVYVADTDNNTIRKITPAGVVSTLAGLAGSRGTADGGGGSARFTYPADVAVDSSSNVYVAESGNSTIRKITPAGVVSTLAGLARNFGTADGTGSAARFNSPEGIAVDNAGNIYLADTYNQTIREITPAGGVSTLAGLAPGSADGIGDAARFSSPGGVAVDNAGSIYVADAGNATIRKITPTGVVSTLAGLAGSFGSADGSGSDARFRGPSGIAVDSTGNIYVADTYTIRKVTPTGVVSTLAGLAGFFGSADGSGSDARFQVPNGIAVDNAGNVYVADTFNYTIRKITPDGVVSTLAGSAGTSGSADGTGSAALFGAIFDVAVDSAGDVYVADSDNCSIRKISPTGEVSHLAGTSGTCGSSDGTGSAAQFTFVAGVAVDTAGNVYVADSANSTIRKITPAGVVSTLAGLPGTNGSADGTASTARFYYPQGIAVDNAGNVYVADTLNHTVRLGRSTSSSPTPTPTPSSLGNISTRLRLQGEDNVLIGGMIATGTANKKVIIRAIGPTLSDFGVPGALMDPTLDLYQGNNLLFTNDDWRNSSQQGEIAVSGFAPNKDAEAAIIWTLTPGQNYTAIVRGKNGQSGVAVVEAFDLDVGGASKLGNISTRGFVGLNDNVMIAGLIVSPNSGSGLKVLVRALGPTLDDFGVPGTLADPTLDLVNASGTVIRSNDNWKDSQRNEIEAAQLTPSHDQESALVETLAPGAYTAVVRGSGQTTGVGLVEVYNIP